MGPHTAERLNNIAQLARDQSDGMAETTEDILAWFTADLLLLVNAAGVSQDELLDRAREINAQELEDPVSDELDLEILNP